MGHNTNSYQNAYQNLRMFGRAQTRAARALAIAAGALAGLMEATGCSTSVTAECSGVAYAERARFGTFDRGPRARMGCLPFPGLTTLYVAAPPEALGEHSYLDESGETSRGLVYTTRGGFLDIAHVRNTIDLTAYIHARVSHAMHAGWSCVRFSSFEPSVYTVHLEYPAEWGKLSTVERSRVIDEASVRLSQRLALEAMTWHEILTWHGFKSMGVFSEAGSAFTYEDGPSHAVGVLIAGEALRRTGGISEAFDREVTGLLDMTLSDLGVVSKDQMKEAIASVKGDWWEDNTARKRFLETGLENNTVTPWLVPGLAFDDGSGPVVWSIPTLGDVFGQDCTGLARVEIDPRVFERGDIVALLPESRGEVEPERDFPVLIAAIRDEIGAERASVEPRERVETATNVNSDPGGR